ncbi:MAG: hypothetical protein DRN81_06685, partial [Thermoproteota archaeon]
LRKAKTVAEIEKAIKVWVKILNCEKKAKKEALERARKVRKQEMRKRGLKSIKYPGSSVIEKVSDKTSKKFLEALKKWVRTREKCATCEEKYKSECKEKKIVCPKEKQKIKETSFLPRGEGSYRILWGDTYVYFDEEGNPIGVYLPLEAEKFKGFTPPTASTPSGYLLEPPWELRKPPMLKDLPKLKPRPKDTGIPGHVPVEEETPPERGITYRTKVVERGEVKEEETTTLVPVEETYRPCEETKKIGESPCPAPGEGFYLAGYHKYGHFDGAKEVEGWGLYAPSNQGYEELIFEEKHTIACIYEPLKTLEEYVPKLTKEDCPPPKEGFELVGWGRVVNHRLVESWGKQEVSGEGYTHVKSRTVVRDCVPVVDEVLTCYYEPVVVEVVPLEEAITKGWIKLEGMGTAYGDIFKLTSTPKAPPDITVRLEPVTALEPAKEYEEEYQDMVTSNLEPRELVFRSSVVVKGYCLDAFKEPPPPGIPYRVGKLPDRRQIVDIIRAGEDLYLIGEFDQEYMPPEEYKMFVVQQAIWVYRTKGTPEELGREDIRENLFAIMGVIEMRTGKIIPEELKNRFFEEVWEDVQAVLRKARLT